MNKPVGMLVGGSGVALCKVLVGETCVCGTCVEVAWMSGGGLGSVIIGTVPSWEAGGTMPISGWPIYGIELLIIGSQCNILLRKYKCHAFFFFFVGGYHTVYIYHVSHAAMCLLAQLLTLLAKLRAANFFLFFKNFFEIFKIIFFLFLYICNDCSACYCVPSGSCCLALGMLCTVLCCHVLAA